MEEINTFGFEFRPRPQTQVAVHMALFKDLPLGDPRKFEHYRAIVSHFFGPNSALPFVWTKRAIRMGQAFCAERVVYVSGNRSSGKTRSLAMYLFVTWLCNPTKSLGLCLSTDIEGGMKRVWGDILKIHDAMPVNPDGKQIGRVTKQPANTLTLAGGRYPKSGLELIAAGLPMESRAQRKLQGFSSSELNDEAALIVGIDEGPGVAGGAYSAFYDNLMAKSRKAQLIVLGNFESQLNTFGQKCEPKEGWKSLLITDTESTEEWRNKDGDLILHFDGLMSENWLAQENIHPFEDRVEEIQKWFDNNRTNEPGFWTMVRSWPAPAGTNMGMIYNEADILAFHAREQPDVTTSTFRKFVGVDPAFVGEQGDECIATVLAVGTVAEKLYIVCLEQRAFVLDTSQSTRGPSYQIADQTRSMCAEYGVPLSDVGYDSSDNGFRDVMGGEGFSDATKIQFSGMADEEVASDIDPRPNNQRFIYMVSQLWANGVDYLRGGHLWGIPEACVLQLCARKWKGGMHGGRQQVESKREMKKRTNKVSPDRGDSFVLTLATAIRKMGLRAGKEGVRAKPPDHKALLAKLQAPYLSRDLQTAAKHHHTGRRSTGWMAARRKLNPR